MVEGIGVTAQSLLSRPRQSVKRQDTNDLKERAIEFLLKRADDYFTTRYDDWFKSESARTASRLLKTQEDLITKDKAYDSSLLGSGKSQRDYEKELVEKTINDTYIAQRLPIFNDFSADDKAFFKYGSKDGSYKGLIPTLVDQRIEARVAYDKAKSDLNIDPTEQRRLFKELNPNKKGLGGAFISTLSSLGFGKGGEQDKEKLIQDKLTAISSNTEQLEKLNKIKREGFSFDQAFKSLNAEIEKRADRRLGQVKARDIINETIVVDQADGSKKVITVPAIREIVEFTNGSVVGRVRPLSKGEGSKDEVALSQQNASILGKGTSGTNVKEYEEEDPITGIKLTGKQVIEYGEGVNGKLVVTDIHNIPDAGQEDKVRRVNNPDIMDLDEGVAENGYNEFSIIFPAISNVIGGQTLEDLNPFIDEGTISDANQYKATQNYLGGKYALIKARLQKDYNLEDFGVSDLQLSRMAGQILLIDKYTQTKLGDVSTGKTLFKGESYKSLPITKVLLSLDLLRSEGSLGLDERGLPISANSIINTLIDREPYLETEDQKAYFRKNINIEQQGDIYERSMHDAGEMQVIMDLFDHIKTNDEAKGRALDSSIFFRINVNDANGNKITLYEAFTGEPVLGPPSGDEIIDKISAKRTGQASAAGKRGESPNPLQAALGREFRRFRERQEEYTGGRGSLLERAEK